MGTPSPVATSFHTTFEREFLPLLQQLGFETAKPKHLKPGLVVALASRTLGADRRLDATLWCDARGSGLRFRFDVIEPINGVECTRQLDLKVPWPDPGYPKPASLDFSGKVFLPERSPERLALAITFLAGAFAASVGTVGELEEQLRAARETPAWRASIERAKGLWKTR